MEIEYFTNRKIGNGNVKVLKLKNSEFAKIELVCPNCNSKSNFEEKWENLIKGQGINQKIIIKCKNCSNEIVLEKMRKEIKKLK